MEITMAETESSAPLFKGMWLEQAFTGVAIVVQTVPDYWQPANVE